MIDNSLVLIDTNLNWVTDRGDNPQEGDTVAEVYTFNNGKWKRIEIIHPEAEDD